MPPIIIIIIIIIIICGNAAKQVNPNASARHSIFAIVPNLTVET
jgi:hypothetical protein